MTGSSPATSSDAGFQNHLVSRWWTGGRKSVISSSRRTGILGSCFSGVSSPPCDDREICKERVLPLVLSKVAVGLDCRPYWFWRFGCLDLVCGQVSMGKGFDFVGLNKNVIECLQASRSCWWQEWSFVRFKIIKIGWNTGCAETWLRFLLCENVQVMVAFCRKNIPYCEISWVEFAVFWDRNLRTWTESGE